MMENKIIISADSTCDLSVELLQRYGIITVPLHVNMAGADHLDMVDITPADIYDNFEKTGELPKTAAVNTQEYVDKFKPYIDNGYDIVHINLGRALSGSYQNCCAAAKQTGHIYPVDSCSLSSGSGLLVIAAANMMQQGLSAAEIARKTQMLAPKSHASFIVGQLEYLRAGGRCSTVAMLGANLLGIKPSIEVHNNDGSMTMGKKYRGKLDHVLTAYVQDCLNRYDNIDYDRVFITHSGIDKTLEQQVYKQLKKENKFKEIFITGAGCTISSHCGANTLGVLFMTK